MVRAEGIAGQYSRPIGSTLIGMTETQIEPQTTAVFHPIQRDSETAVLAFSPVSSKKNRFHFFPLSRLMPDVSILLVRDPANHWYNAGLPGAGDTVEEIAERIRAELDALGARRVVTLGSSMGGYAAILFGCMLAAQQVVSLTPQTFLDPDLPYGPPASLTPQAPDLAPVVDAATQTSIDVVVGWDLLSDVFYARNVAASKSVRVLGVPGEHTFPQELHAKGEYWPLIVDLIEGRTPAVCDPTPAFDRGEDERIRDAVFAKRDEDWPALEERIAPLAERYPGWIAPNFYHGKALANLGEWERAETILAKVVSASHRWNRPRDDLVWALCQGGRLEEAEGVIRDGIAVSSVWWRGRLALGACLFRLGRREEARGVALEAEEMLRNAVAKLPAFPRGYLGLAAALMQLGREEEARATARRAMELDPKLTALTEESLAGGCDYLARPF
jgi:pimeloyl-ACP methyl ester carboxylesterase